jgi:hypothetical protein
MTVKTNRAIRVLILVLFATASVYSQERDAVIKGKVSDQRGAIFVKAKVFAANNISAFTSETSEWGEYVIKVAPGIYDIKVEAPFSGVSDSHRAPVEVRPNSVAIANFTLFSDLSVVTEYENKNLSSGSATSVPDDIPRKPLSYDRVVFPGGGRLNGLIRYGNKKRAGRYTIYRSGMLEDNESISNGVEFTFNLFRLEAKEIKLDTKTHKIHATGHVTVESNGTKRKYAGNISVSVLGGIVRLKT